jgi:hypothetical protein
MKHKTIKGRVQYVELATGFWCIVDSRYRKWRLLDAPAALQQEGLRVQATVEVVEEGASVFMSGTAVRVLNFSIHET